MIKYDYEIQRNVGNDIEIFVPDKIDVNLPNLVYIEGPNSSGKSTLLNLLAIAFYGHRSKKINEILLRKMNSLIDSNYQKIKFNIEVKNKDSSLILRSIKELDNHDIFVEEIINGESKPLTFDRFENRYNLIYDIPNNPTERLYDLLDEVKDEQLRYGTKIKDFYWYLRNIIKEISEYRDPDRISNLKSTLKRLKENNKELKLKIPILNELLNNLEKYFYLYFYSYYKTEYYTLSNKLEKYEVDKNKLIKEMKKVSKKQKKIRDKITFLLDKISEKHYNLTSLIISNLIPSEKSRIDIWKNINVYNIKDNKLDNNLISETLHYLNIFYIEKEKIEENESFNNASIIQNIISFLKNYENSQIIIPKIDLNIKELINILEEENISNELLIKKHNNIIHTIELLEDIKLDIDSINDELGNYENIVIKDEEISEEIYEYQDSTETIAQLKKRLNILEQNYNKYMKLSLTKNLNLEDKNFSLINELKIYGNMESLQPYYSLNEKQLSEEIISLRHQIQQYKDSLAQTDVYIEEYTKQLKELEKLKPHKYEIYQKELEILAHTTNVLSQKLLSDSDQFITNLRKGKVKKLKNDFENKYYNEISKYLAYRIGEFKHIDNTYIAKEIDLIKGIINTKSNRIIRLSDMGTGQSQAAYLLGLLNVKDDNRKILALFDEIAMMDSNTLIPIYKKLNNLYISDRLLLGIVVQRADKVHIKSLEDI